MIVLAGKRNGGRCVFKGLCDHAPSTHVAYHEFANYPPKLLCTEHAIRVEKFTEPKRKR